MIGVIEQRLCFLLLLKKKCLWKRLNHLLTIIIILLPRDFYLSGLDMRSRLAIGFIFLYMIALCRPVAPLIEYYANQDFFATVLCINKDKPELKCNGQCILMQKLKKSVHEESSSAPVPKVNFEDYPIGIMSSLRTPLQQFPITLSIGNANYWDNYYFISGTDLFHPPRPYRAYS